MTIEFFSEHLIPGPDRDKLLYIAGMLSVFDDLIGSNSVHNQRQAKDYDPSKPQGVTIAIYSETDPEPDTGTYFTIFADETVEVMELMSFPAFKDGEIDTTQPRYLEREDSEITLKQLLLWLRSQSPKLHAYM